MKREVVYYKRKRNARIFIVLTLISRKSFLQEETRHKIRKLLTALFAVSQGQLKSDLLYVKNFEPAKSPRIFSKMTVPSAHNPATLFAITLSLVRIQPIILQDSVANTAMKICSNCQLFLWSQRIQGELSELAVQIMLRAAMMEIPFHSIEDIALLKQTRKYLLLTHQ